MSKKDDILKIITGRTFISQAQAADILEVSPSHISLLIKKGKLEAFTDGTPPKPYLDSVLSYKTKPSMKRHRNITVNGNNNIIGSNNRINIKNSLS